MMKILTITEAAHLLKVKPSWLRMMIFKKRIPYLKIGGLVRFEEQVLVDWLKRANERGL